ncbi:MAG: hypothetical protein KBT75_04150 [Oleispira antarctica]|jgi:hypothetical protein|nr:hypothetical protein [Oleispira antarctica]MBQ0791597.1 hypothetical protein [Oleispira antarctica]
MNIELALNQFYKESGFEPETGKRPAFVEVFVGCLLIPLPNIEIRRKYIKYHDLHHVINDFNSSQAGEGEVSAWELGTGSMLHPILMFMNLIAISTALAINPVRVFKAYLVGCKSKNLYCPKVRRRIDSGELNDIEQLKREFLNCRCSDAWIALKMIPFVIFALLSIVIHLILVIPALLYKKVWGRFFQAKLVKVVKVRS